MGTEKSPRGHVREETISALRRIQFSANTLVTQHGMSEDVAWKLAKQHLANKFGVTPRDIDKWIAEERGSTSQEREAAIIADLQIRPKLKTTVIARRNGVGKQSVIRLRHQLEGKTRKQRIQEMKDALPAHLEAGLLPGKIAELHDVGRTTVQRAIIELNGGSNFRDQDF